MNDIIENINNKLCLFSMERYKKMGINKRGCNGCRVLCELY